MRRQDYWVIGLLVAICLIFFWRLLTPNEADAVSFTTIDFTTLFTPWTSYSVERFHAGEFPLWNPYMYGGTSFIGDPQNVLFYPIRWLTIGALALAFDSDIANSDMLFALEIEMVGHVLLGTLFMYAFLRKHTLPSASLVGALIWGYGGYMTSYPPAQLPILETAIWIPLVLFGIDRIRDANNQINWNWVLLSGLFFGLSILAGHTQTSMLTGYLALSYIIYRLWGIRWPKVIWVIGIFGIVAIGLSAIQILPTAEFQMHTTRDNFSFEHKGTGFAWHEIGMALFPKTLGDWSPFYIGIISLGLVSIAIWRKKVGYWIGVSIVALLLAFGKRTMIYSTFYLLVPGFKFFRFQERAILILTVALSVMAAYGMDALQKLEWTIIQKRYLNLAWTALIIILGLFAAVFWVQRLDQPNSSIDYMGAQSAMFSFLLALGSLVIFAKLLQGKQQWQWAVVVLLVFDLFSVNMNIPFNYDRTPVDEKLIEPEYMEIIRDNTFAGQTVDGERGVGYSYGALYRVRDIFGTGPLRLQALEFYLYQLAPERRWDILGVQVVTSEKNDLPMPNNWLGQGTDERGTFYIYQIQNHRAFAMLYYDMEIVNSPQMAWKRVADPTLDLRKIVIVENDFDKQLTGESTDNNIGIVIFEPEYIELLAHTDQPAIASFALPYAPGWQAIVDGEEVEIIRTYGGMSGIYLEKGEHKIVLRYLPDSFVVGAIMTGLTLLSVLIAFFLLGYQKRHQPSQVEAEELATG